jgi:hypothetical protein
MNRDLHAEVVGFLAEHGPSTSMQIAAGIRERRSAIDQVLLAGPFVEAPTPDGANPRARHWADAVVQSQDVQARPKGQGRAATMLAVLADGKEHTRADIFKASGKFFLTNNAAAELRSKGYDVRSREIKRGEHGYFTGLVVYWLVAKPASVAAYRATRAKARSAVAERFAA